MRRTRASGRRDSSLPFSTRRHCAQCAVLRVTRARTAPDKYYDKPRNTTARHVHHFWVKSMMVKVSAEWAQKYLQEVSDITGRLAKVAP